MKRLPFRVKVKAALPAPSVAGDSDVMASGATGVVTARFMRFEATAPGLVTCTAKDAAATTDVAGTDTVSRVALPKAVVIAEPPTLTTAPLTNPVPSMVSVKPPLPATTLAGAIEATVAAAGGGGGGGDCEPEPPPPQPATTSMAVVRQARPIASRDLEKRAAAAVKGMPCMGVSGADARRFDSAVLGGAALWTRYGSRRRRRAAALQTMSPTCVSKRPARRSAKKCSSVCFVVRKAISSQGMSASAKSSASIVSGPGANSVSSSRAR